MTLKDRNLSSLPNLNGVNPNPNQPKQAKKVKLDNVERKT